MSQAQLVLTKATASRRLRAELRERIDTAATEARERAALAAINFARHPDDEAARATAVGAVAESDELEVFRRVAIDSLSHAVHRVDEKLGRSAGDSTVTATVTGGEKMP